MADDLEIARLHKLNAKLERNLADLEVYCLRQMAWADQVTLIMDFAGVDYPPHPRFKLDFP